MATKTKPTKEHKYYLFVPLMMPQAVDKVIAVLVKRGYTVAPASNKKNAYISTDNNLVTLLALDVKKDLEEGDVEPIKTIFSDVTDILEVTGTRYYALFLTLSSNCRWGLGNVKKELITEVGPCRTPGKDLN